MTAWHFHKGRRGWSWQRTGKHGTAKSPDNFPDIRDAIADAALYGYISGKSRIGTMGSVPVKRRPAAEAIIALSDEPPPTKLVFRRNMKSRWIWELRSHDRHLLNRSEADFATREECEADAVRNGHSEEATKGELQR